MRHLARFSFYTALVFIFPAELFSQWACKPLGQGGQVVCGWACYSGHQGQDWQYTPNNTSYGQNVYAVYDGTVVYIRTGYTLCDDPFIAGGNDWNQPANIIIIQHPNGYSTRYLHIKDIVPGIAVGSTVSQGQVIAYVGNVGPISPCDNANPNVNAHLHFEVGTGWSGIALTGKFDPVSIFTGCYPPFCCSSTTLTNTNCSDGFSDSGGSNATYSNFENYTFTIAPPAATSVTVNFNWLDIESGYDFLYVYDGTSPSDPLIGTYTGTSIPASITSATGAITFQFTSDVSIQGQGWNADWSCTTAPPPAPLALTTGQAACPNISATLSWQNSGSNWAVDVSDDPSFSYFWTRSVANQTSVACPDAFAHNAIPNAYLIFQPQQTYYWRVWNGITHTNGNSFIVPFCSSSDNACAGVFSDAGGPSGNYTANEDYLFVIQPLNAATVTLNFSGFDIEQGYDSLWIYDGPALPSMLIGAYTGTVSPGTVSAGSGTMTVRFKSDSYVENPGWTASWTCLSSTEVTEQARGNSFKTYPNPASDQLTITSELPGLSIKKVRLINSVGQQVLSQKGNEHSSQVISVRDLPDALYFLQITTADNLQTGKSILISK